jgi:hypothetical protein
MDAYNIPPEMISFKEIGISDIFLMHVLTANHICIFALLWIHALSQRATWMIHKLKQPPVEREINSSKLASREMRCCLPTDSGGSCCSVLCHHCSGITSCQQSCQQCRASDVLLVMVGVVLHRDESWRCRISPSHIFHQTVASDEAD